MRYSDKNLMRRRRRIRFFTKQIIVQKKVDKLNLMR